MLTKIISLSGRIFARTWVNCRSSNLIKALTLTALVLLSLMSFQNSATITESSAVVNRIDGYYIFIQSKPLMAHEVVGTVSKTGIVMEGSPKEMMNIILRRVKKKYPNADGIIFRDHELEHAEVIQFKK